MAKYMSIVQSAYRATIEEQDDPAVWFSHAMKNGGADMAVLLRGDAVSYAIRGQDASGLQFGARRVKGPDIARDIGALIAANVPVYVTSEDLSARGIDDARMLSGVRLVSKSALGKLVDAFDRIIAF
jgi:sulfur transfer complex TusBCD TusB component (DsrH family)